MRSAFLDGGWWMLGAAALHWLLIGVAMGAGAPRPRADDPPRDDGYRLLNEAA